MPENFIINDRSFDVLFKCLGGDSDASRRRIIDCWEKIDGRRSRSQVSM